MTVSSDRDSSDSDSSDSDSSDSDSSDSDSSDGDSSDSCDSDNSESKIIDNDSDREIVYLYEYIRTCRSLCVWKGAQHRKKETTTEAANTQISSWFWAFHSRLVCQDSPFGLGETPFFCLVQQNLCNF